MQVSKYIKILAGKVFLKMKYATVLMLVAVVISTNVSATLIIGENQMSAFAQREENTSNVTSNRIQEQTQLNAHERNARTDINIDNRDIRLSPSLDDTNAVSERNPTTPDDAPVQTETDTSSDSAGTETSNTEEAGSATTGEVGSSNANEVGSTDSNFVTEDQDQDNRIEGTATESDPLRNNRDDPAYQAVLNFSRTSVEVATNNFVDSVQGLVLEHTDDVLAQGQNPSARILARVGFASTVNTLRGPVGASLEIFHAATALTPAPTCAPGDPSCTPPPPTEEPANCDPHVTKSCFPDSGESPCTPAEVSGATCKSGIIECEQTPLKHNILCQADFPEGGFWQGVYFTPPGLKPQFLEQLCTPNPNPPPFNNCVSTSY